MTSRSQSFGPRDRGAEDLLLVQRALRGEGPAVEGLVQRLSCIARFVQRLNRDCGYDLEPDTLGDVVQQVHAALWGRLADFTGEAALESWAYGFCRNCLRSEVRRRHGAVRVTPAGGLLEGALDPGDGPDRAAETGDRLERLLEELERLDEGEREAVRLRHLEGWSFEEIGRRRGLAASTVKDRCYRALDKLRARLTAAERGTP